MTFTVIAGTSPTTVTSMSSVIREYAWVVPSLLTLVWVLPSGFALSM
jgi:hypothetical protein